MLGFFYYRLVSSCLDLRFIPNVIRNQPSSKIMHCLLFTIGSGVNISVESSSHPRLKLLININQVQQRPCCQVKNGVFVNLFLITTEFQFL